MSKAILVTGATGKQGGAVIDALAGKPGFTLLAVTRNPTGSSAQKLTSKADNIKVVQGDLDDVPGMFKNAGEVAKSPIWGVYSVQISMGKGVTFESEVNQGKAMVDESVKQGVKHFVYSSVERGGDEASWDNGTPIPHFQTKQILDNYLRDNAGQMGWTILRPVAFMDNLAPGFPSKVFMAALNNTLGQKKLQWVATADIGVFAANAFQKPEEYNHKALGLAGDELNPEEISKAFENTTGTSMQPTFWFLGNFLMYMVAEMGKMVTWFGTDGYKADIPALKKMHPGLMDMETWIKQNNAFPKK